MSKADVAFAAEKTAHLFGRMTMIDAGLTFALLFADRTNAALPRQQRVIVLRCKPVAVISALSLPVFGVGP